VVEHLHGKEGVSGSNPDHGSTSEITPTKHQKRATRLRVFSLVSHVSSFPQALSSKLVEIKEVGDENQITIVTFVTVQAEITILNESMLGECSLDQS
jgi:hypothetical protein